MKDENSFAKNSKTKDNGNGKELIPVAERGNGRRHNSSFSLNNSNSFSKKKRNYSYKEANLK